MKKNDDVILDITALTVQGAGIGHHEGMAVFVAQTAVGDRVKAHIIKVKSSYAIGKLTEVLIPSESRIGVDCPVFDRCGGCQFRHIDYQTELKVKQTAVYDAMKRIGGIDLPPCDVTPSPLQVGYRNKAQYPLAVDEQGLYYGFYAEHSHRVVRGNGCLLQPPVFERAMSALKVWADQNKLTAYNEQSGEGLLRHALLRFGEAYDQLMVVVVINADTLPAADSLINIMRTALGDTLCSLQYNVNKRDTNVILGDKTCLIYGRPTVSDIICGVTVDISAESFYQVNRPAAELLYKKAAAYIGDEDRVILDLFCGIGTIGLSLLKLCTGAERRLIGVEIVEKAVENAVENAKKCGAQNARFIAADATAAARLLRREGVRPDLVVVDPPRKGCDEALLKIIAEDFSPSRLIYVSCDPATLARDSRILSENGYTLQEYSPVDLFPGTAHVETVALFSRQKAGRP